MNSLAIVYNKNNNDEINKLNEFCRYENISLDYFSHEKDFKNICDFIVRNNVSKLFLTDAKVLDEDLKSFTEKIISLHKINISVLCASYDFPDPFQLAIRTLSINGKDPERINKIKDSINKKASRGQVLGKIPYGYKKNSSGFFEENVDQSKNVRKIFDFFNNDFSISEITKELLKTSLNEKWSNQKVKHILKNDFYTGIYRRYNVVIPNSHQPIINKQDFDNANKQFNKNQKRIYKKNYWNGILFCGLCLNKLSITNHKNSWIKDGNKKTKIYKYYNCKNTNNHKKLKIKYEILNELLDKKFNKEMIQGQIIEQSYVYKLISQLSNSKILFDEFIDKFEQFNKLDSEKNNLIKKIFIKEIDTQIIISID